MDFYAINGAAVAFLAGVFSSPHCVGMCGPLGCAAFSLRANLQHAQLGLATYHLIRCFAYACIGLLAGALGTGTLVLFDAPLTAAFPYVLIATFLVVGFRLDRYIPKPKVWHRLYFQFSRRIKQAPPWAQGWLLGAATPFLPCGPLYLIFIVCFSTGSALRGAEIAIGFAMGTIPLLWFAQSQYVFLSQRIPPKIRPWLQGGMACLASGLILWRTLAHDGFTDVLCY